MDEMAWENNTTAQTLEYGAEETNVTAIPEKKDRVAYYSIVSITAVLSLALGANIIYRCFHQDTQDIMQDV